MAFSQSGIINVRVMADGPDLFVNWSSSLPSGTTYQVYLDRRLVWSGTSMRCHAPIPSGVIGRNVWVEVGTVGAFEPLQDYSTSLAAPGGRSERAELAWTGGTYLDPTGHDDIQAFQIYQSPAAGVPVGLASASSSAIDTVAAYPGGWINDGFGKGGFGNAGFGRASTQYSWRSGPLTSGIWQFAVVPTDRAGNAQGAGQVVNVTINAAPRPPAVPASGGSRLTYTYAGPSHPQITLSWLPSPSDI